MFALRCTQKLLDRISLSPDLEPAPPDTVLGDWYANLVRVGRTQLVLAVSERTLLPVVVPAREGRTMARQVAEAIEPMLIAIGVPTDAANAERVGMQDAVIAKTASRRVLGSLNDLAFQLQVGLQHFPGRPLLAQSLWLAQTPLKLIEGTSPDRATLAAFAAHEAVHRAAGR